MHRPHRRKPQAPRSPKKQKTCPQSWADRSRVLVSLLCCVPFTIWFAGSAWALELPDESQAWDNRYIVTFAAPELTTSQPLSSERPAERAKARRQSATGSSSSFSSTAAIAASKMLMQNARTMVTAEGGEVRHELPRLNAVAVRLSKDQLARFAQRDGIESIELDPPRYPLMDGSVDSQIPPYGIALVQSDQVPYGGAPGITVCVVDTGFDLGHPDLPTSVRVTGASAPGIGPWFEDPDGHGTHVAGSIMALGNTEGVLGATNGGEFRVHIYRVFDEEGAAASSSDVIAGVQSCVDAGARVVNLSLGCTGTSCYSASEERAFATFSQAGILTVAAAGNDGADSVDGTMPSYPAGYAGVIAVGALDESKNIATFSQRYPEVELSAPGVRVRSTIPRGTGFGAQVSAAGQSVESEAFQASPVASASALLADCGSGGSVCTDVSGQVCLIERGTFLFVEKAQNCEAGGGVGAIIYNNVPGPIGNGTLGDNPGVTIPVTGVSDTVGATLLTRLGQLAQISVGPVDYGELSGTSMATPHVAGVAALVWSRAPERTNEQIRAVLQSGAEDLGEPGRDNSYGFGLVQALNSVLALSGDSDSDGIGNGADNCALVVNADQRDSDADGTGDVCDLDADGDGMNNDYETENSLDPFAQDALGDQDNDGFSNLSEFYASTSSVNASSTPQVTSVPLLVAAVLPSSRSAVVGQSVTAFATMINASGQVGINCSVAPLDPLAMGYQFFATEAGTNAIVGAANTTVNIASNAAQSFVLRLTPQATLAPREVKLRFGCDNLGAATVVDGLTTLLLSASSEPVADLIALAATPTNNGVVETNANGAGAFGVASVNLGASAQLTATATGTNTNVPLALSICPTDLFGNCVQAANTSVELVVATNATPTFSVFAQVSELTAFDPANTRIRVTFSDSSGAIRGATSVAIVRNN